MEKILISIINIINIIRDFTNWPLVILNYLHIRKAVTLKHRNGLHFFCHNRAHSKIIQEMFQGMIYNKHLIDQIGQTLHKKTIIDIGAHVGSFSFWFDFHCPGNTFYLYEPDKNTFDILQKNVWLNYKKKFHIFNICVAYKSGIVTFYSTSSKGQTQSSSILHRSANEDKYSINAKTLIDIITENKITQVDLVKMDCEGAEFDIILQAPTRLWAIVKAILFEYHDDISGKSHEQLVKSLKPFYNTIVVHPARYNKFRGTIFAKN